MNRSVNNSAELSSLLPKQEQQQTEKTTPKQIIAVALLTLAFAFARTAATIQLLATPLAAKLFLQTHGANAGLSAVPLSFLFFGATFMAPLASQLMAKIGRQKGLILGCYFGVIGSGITVLGQVFHRQEDPIWVPFTLLSLGSLFLGFANGYVNFFRFAAADIVPHRRSLAISVVLFGGDISALVGPTATVWLANKYYHFGASYIFVGALFFCTILVLFFVDIPPMVQASGVNAAPPRGMLTLLKIPRLSLALLTATISFGVMVFVMVLIPLVMTEEGFSLDLISHVLQIHSIGMFAPGLIVGLLIEKFGCLIVNFIGLLILLSGNLTMFVGGAYWHFIVGMLLLGIGWNFSFISSTTLLTTCYLPSEKAKTQGLNDFVMYFIVSVMSLTSGYLWKALGTWGYFNMLSSAMVMLGIIAVIFVALSEACSRKKAKAEDDTIN